MIRVHQDEAVKYPCQRLRVGRGNLRGIRDREHVISNLTSAIVLGDEDVCILLQLSPLFSNHRKDMLLFEHALVIILTERPKKFCGLLQGCRIHL